MDDWAAFVNSLIDPDIGYAQFYDYIDWVTYGWVTEPVQSS